MQETGLHIPAGNSSTGHRTALAAQYQDHCGQPKSLQRRNTEWAQVVLGLWCIAGHRAGVSHSGMQKAGLGMVREMSQKQEAVRHWNRVRAWGGTVRGEWCEGGM